MRLFGAMRHAALAGSYLSVGFLLPCLILGAMWASLELLFSEMAWPRWIVWVAIILAIIGLDDIFTGTYVVAIVAGFFHPGVWPWSLVAIGTIVVGWSLWWILIGLHVILAGADDADFAPAPDPTEGDEV